MKIRKTIIIPSEDLKKMMDKKGIKSLYQLARLASIDYGYLGRAHAGKVKLSEKTWEKIKIALDN